MAAASLDAELLEALARQDLSLAETVHLRTGPAMATRRSLPQEASARLTVPVGPGEDAVVLLEQAEVYSWSLPAARLAVPAGARRAGGAVDQVAFDLPLGPVAPDRTDRRMLGGALLAPVRAYVFRFVGRRLVDGAVRIQEHNVRPGLVRIAGRDPAAWAAGEPIVPAAPKAGGRHRVLLAIHGTFSSTAGGFGQLGPTAWGGAFLDACQARYDLVLGYDHRTLSETPAENAVALLAALRGLDWGGGAAPEIDVVAHSRGGLVARWLIEALAPGSGWGAVFRRAILVGATNGGTELARPENWSAFLDLYTNLAVAACRALTFLPQAAPVATILAETIATLGEFVKQIPLSGLDSGVAPGLFAMTPDNPFLKDLNGLQPGQFAAADAIYHVVSSSFAPTLFGTDHQPKEFPLRLVQVLGSSTVTALMRGAENDLVVDTPSMSAIDSAFGDFVRDTLHFAASPLIYHTNYFARPEVVNALTRWLDLAAADVPAAGARRGGGRAPAALPELGRGRTDLPAAVETDILVADPARNAPEFLAELAAKAPSFVVLESGGPESGRLAHVFDPSELTTVLDGAVGPVASALGLPDRTGDVVVPDSRIARATGRGQSVFPSGLTASRDRLTRLVVSSEAGPVGVVPNAAEAVLDGDIGSLAAGVAASTDRILTRRAMPTFTWSGTAQLEGGQFGGGRPRPGGTSPIQGRRGLAAEGGSPAPSLPDTVTPLAQDSSPSPDDQPGPETAECHIQAESPSKVKVGATLTVSVAVSRTAIEATMAENAMGIAVVDPGRPITINVLPKTGFTFGNDEEPAEIRLPPVGKVEQIYFDLKAAETGKGEIWVVARQGKLPLLTLKLEPEVIAAKARASTKKLSRGASASLVRGPDPDHTLTIIEVERTEAGTTFRFEFNSPILDKIQIDKIRVPGNRDIFVEGLYHEIENYWINNSRDADNFNSQLREFGVSLFRKLVPEKIQANLWQYRKEIDGIQVISEEPFIPWEMLFLIEPGETISDEGRFLAELGLVRWLYEAGRHPPSRLAIRKDRARHLIPTYPVVPGIALKPLPEAQAEAAFLGAAFGSTPIKSVLTSVTPLLQGPGSFDLLHFAGHGAAAEGVVGQARLMLDGQIVPQGYVPEYLRADHVEFNMKAGDGRPVVVLNACQAGRANWQLTGLGGFAQAFLKRGVGLFVGTLWSVGDAPARVFTEAFYKALKSGLTVGEAARQARGEAKNPADPTWLAYAVYGHPGATLARDDD